MKETENVSSYKEKKKEIIWEPYLVVFFGLYFLRFPLFMLVVLSNFYFFFILSVDLIICWDPQGKH